MNIFTYLNEKEKQKLISFLDSEINKTTKLMCVNSRVDINKNILDYSNALFKVSDDEDNEFILLN